MSFRHGGVASRYASQDSEKWRGWRDYCSRSQFERRSVLWCLGSFVFFFSFAVALGFALLGWPAVMRSSGEGQRVHERCLGYRMPLSRCSVSSSVAGCCTTAENFSTHPPPPIIMHRVARGFSTAASARCQEMTSLARLAAHSPQRRRETASSSSSGRSRSRTLAEDGWFMSQSRYRINRRWDGRLSLARRAEGRRGGLPAGPTRPSQQANQRCALSRCLSLSSFSQ